MSMQPTTSKRRMRSIAERECKLAKKWRVSRELTIDKLADMAGYSRESILVFEKGRQANGTIITTKAWVRYRHVCAAIDVMLRTQGIFQWGSTWVT